MTQNISISIGVQIQLAKGGSLPIHRPQNRSFTPTRAHFWSGTRAQTRKPFFPLKSPFAYPLKLKAPPNSCDRKGCQRLKATEMQ